MIWEVLTTSSINTKRIKKRKPKVWKKSPAVPPPTWTYCVWFCLVPPSENSLKYIFLYTGFTITFSCSRKYNLMKKIVFFLICVEITLTFLWFYCQREKFTKKCYHRLMKLKIVLRNLCLIWRYSHKILQLALLYSLILRWLILIQFKLILVLREFF